MLQISCKTSNFFFARSKQSGFTGFVFSVNLNLQYLWINFKNELLKMTFFWHFLDMLIFCHLKPTPLDYQHLGETRLKILSASKAWVILQYTNFPINRVHKFPKVEDTQLVQCPSHLSCPMSKYPKLSKPKLLKAQVTQSSSYPKYKLPKLPKVQVAPK